jgi:hypothetical protein
MEMNVKAARLADKDRKMARTSLLLLSLISISACVCAQAGSTAPAASEDGQAVSEATRAQLLKLVPDPLPSQARALQAPVFYAANLWEYIDGDADRFQLYGLEAMLHQEFQAGGINVTLDIYSMGKPENAFGIYALNRSSKGRFVTIGTEGTCAQSDDGSAATLNFFLDRYYVKLMGFGSGSDAILEAFARGIASRIGVSSGWPAMLALLPSAQRLPHSEQYVLRNPLGHDYLSPAYLVKYQTDKGEYSLVVSVAADEAEALRRLGLLEKHLRQSGKCAEAPEYGEHAIRGSTSYEGEIVASTVGRYLVLIVNPSGNAKQLFQETLTRLK